MLVQHICALVTDRKINLLLYCIYIYNLHEKEQSSQIILHYSYYNDDSLSENGIIHNMVMTYADCWSWENPFLHIRIAEHKDNRMSTEKFHWKLGYSTSSSSCILSFHMNQFHICNLYYKSLYWTSQCLLFCVKYAPRRSAVNKSVSMPRKPLKCFI